MVIITGHAREGEEEGRGKKRREKERKGIGWRKKKKRRIKKIPGRDPQFSPTING